MHDAFVSTIDPSSSSLATRYESSKLLLYSILSEAFVRDSSDDHADPRFVAIVFGL